MDPGGSATGRSQTSQWARSAARNSPIGTRMSGGRISVALGSNLAQVWWCVSKYHQEPGCTMTRPYKERLKRSTQQYAPMRSCQKLSVVRSHGCRHSPRVCSIARRSLSARVLKNVLKRQTQDNFFSDESGPHNSFRAQRELFSFCHSTRFAKRDSVDGAPNFTRGGASQPQPGWTPNPSR